MPYALAAILPLFALITLGSAAADQHAPPDNFATVEGHRQRIVEIEAAAGTDDPALVNEYMALAEIFREMEQFDDQEDDAFDDDAAGDLYGGPLRRWSDDGLEPE